MLFIATKRFLLSENTRDDNWLGLSKMPRNWLFYQTLNLLCYSRDQIDFLGWEQCIACRCAQTRARMWSFCSAYHSTAFTENIFQRIQSRHFPEAEAWSLSMLWSTPYLLIADRTGGIVPNNRRWCFHPEKFKKIEPVFVVLHSNRLVTFQLGAFYWPGSLGSRNKGIPAVTRAFKNFMPAIGLSRKVYRWISSSKLLWAYRVFQW